MPIETARLILRTPTPADVDDFMEFRNTEFVLRYNAMNPTTRERVLAQFSQAEDSETLLMELKETGKVIGSLGVEEYGLEQALTEFTDYKGREIGYVLSKDYWGRGLMPEAVSAVTDYLFRVLDLDFLTCGYYDFNSQSKRVQEKCGFKYHHTDENVYQKLLDTYKTCHVPFLNVDEWIRD